MVSLSALLSEATMDSDELDDVIEDAVWKFEHGDQDDDLSERAQDLAHVIARAAHNFGGYVPEFLELPSDWHELRALVSRDSLRPLVMRALQAELARRYCVNTSDMAARCLELASDPIPGGARSERYVALLARSYIAGFHAEAIILAGSILEDELEAAFERSGVPMPAMTSGKSSINHQIDFAHQVGWLSRDTRELAKSVWHRRCKVVHEDPTLIATAGDTVYATIAVLRELCVVGLQQDEEIIGKLKSADVPPILITQLQDQLQARRRHERSLRRDRPK